MSLEIRLLSYKGNGTQGERIVRTTFRGKIESTVCYTRHITINWNSTDFAENGWNLPCSQRPL